MLTFFDIVLIVLFQKIDLGTFGHLPIQILSNFLKCPNVKWALGTFHPFNCSQIFFSAHGYCPTRAHWKFLESILTIIFNRKKDYWNDYRFLLEEDLFKDSIDAVLDALSLLVQQTFGRYPGFSNKGPLFDGFHVNFNNQDFVLLFRLGCDSRDKRFLVAILILTNN